MNANIKGTLLKAVLSIQVLKGEEKINFLQAFVTVVC